MVDKMPTSSQALTILRDVNTTDMQKLWHSRFLDGSDVKQENHIYGNGAGLGYEALTFQERMSLTFPETKLGQCSTPGANLPEGNQSVDARRSPLFDDLTLSSVDETFDEIVPPPTSACGSDTDLSKDFHQASEMKTQDMGASFVLQPLRQNAFENGNDQQTKPPHRWGVRFMRQSQRPIRTTAGDSQTSNYLPNIHAKSHNGRPQTLCIKSDDQPSNHFYKSYMKCPMLGFQGLGSKSLTNNSWLKDIQRRYPKDRSYWKFRAILLEALSKSDLNHENHKQVVSLLGAKEKQKVQKIAKKETADVEKCKASSSFHFHESGDNSSANNLTEEYFDDLMFTGKNKFSPLSGNPTSTLRRRRSKRANFPSNFMDFTLRFGNGFKLNNIFEAKGRHLKENDCERQESEKEVLNNCQKTVSIAEGVDLQDLLPSRKTQSNLQPPTNGIKIPTCSSSLTSVDKNRSNVSIEKPKGTKTTFPNLMKAGIVEHGFCPPQYDQSSQSMTSGIIEVEGSEPGARRSSNCQRQHVEGPEDSIEQNYDPDERVDRSHMEYSKKNDTFDVHLENRARSQYMATNDGSFALIDGSSNDPLHQVAALKDFPLEIDVQARVREIGLYEKTRKRILATDESIQFEPNSSMISKENFFTAKTDVPSSAHSSTFFKGEEISVQNTLLSTDSGREEFSGRLQNRAMHIGKLNPLGGLSKQYDNWRNTKSTAQGDSKILREDHLYDLNGVPNAAYPKRKERRKDRYISFRGEVILPPSKKAIAKAKTLDAFLEEEVHETLRQFENEKTDQEHYYIEEDELGGDVDASEEYSPEEEEFAYSYWQNEREEHLFRRIKSKVLRMRKELPPRAPNKLCFVSNIASCSHQEVKEEIESSHRGSVTVTHLQYDPVYLGEGTPDRYTGLWIFEISKDSDKINLLLKGFRLKGRPMNVRLWDDVTMEEYRAFQLYDAIRLEQRKKRLNRHFKRR